MVCEGDPEQADHFEDLVQIHMGLGNEAEAIESAEKSWPGMQTMGMEPLKSES